LCGRHETTKHIFFSCSLARFIWSGLGNALGWDKIPSSMGDLQGSRLSQMFGTNMCLGFFFFAGFTWAIWKARNKMAIERSFPNNPIDIVYSGLSFVQSWRRLLKPTDQDKLMKSVEVLKRWLNSYLPTATTISDISYL
jgi:hypothetical protein